MSMLNTHTWTIAEWQAAYRGGKQARELLPALLASLEQGDSAWISLLSAADLQQRIDELETLHEAAEGDLSALPLYGVPFAVKDNIDVAGWVTTCACADYAYRASVTATVVQLLLDAGAVLLGKTNLDQFATGLVGTRSPYGVVPNTFDARYISGGSSSGSATVVARGLVPFSLGTDTAGSGRVPAGFNNIVGLKPTRGLFSAHGLVPACRTLDCVSLFALTVDDADYLRQIVSGFDALDPYSRHAPTQLPSLPAQPVFGIPAQPEWFGDETAATAYAAACQRMRALGVRLQAVDFAPLFKAATLLYEGPWVAERYTVVERLLEDKPQALHPVVRGIIERARKMSAADAFKAEYRRAELAREAEALLQGLDGLLVPTTPTIYSQAEVAAEPVLLNTRLGTYTNFVNLLDWCALTLPAGLRGDGLPFSITLIGQTWKDPALSGFARRWQQAENWRLGASTRTRPALALTPLALDTAHTVTVAVVGAHLSGMQLNHQLTERNAQLLESTRTAPCYRLFALGGTVPPKPGLLRVANGDGAAIVVELWAVPTGHFGSFVALIPPPLGMGTVLLADGREVKGFICEPWALNGAEDITAIGGWRAYMAGRALGANGSAKLAASASRAMFKTILIANRGEIAVRIARTLRRMGIRSVAVYSEADRNSAHVTAADLALPIGDSAPAASYLCVEKIIAAAKEAGAEAIIPGYGFLSENAEFAEACAAAGLVFIGPSAEHMRRFGLKHAARELAASVGVPLVPGTGLLRNLDQAKDAAAQLGYPVMLKSTAGGGGIGLSRCHSEAELVAAFESVQRLGQNFFNDAGVFLERFVDEARHVEVQIFGDGRGQVVALGERDCSVQRRNQKVIEETPAPGLPAATREKLLAAAVQLGRAVAYVSAGTVEFIYDAARDEFYFLEVNTRLQVEHPVTEAVTGLDLVEWMVRIAAGQPPAFDALPEAHGAAIEVRLYAEDPLRNFQPSPGVLTEVVFPPTARVDGWVATGTEVSPHYDPLLAKLIVHGSDRGEALAKLEQALAATRLYGIATNLEYLRQIIASAVFRDARLSTRFLERFCYRPQLLEVLEPGTYTTVQDYPGRVGYWAIGVPPSGPMDDYAFRLANRMVGNIATAAGLECTIQGPSLRFHGDTVICLAGADMQATLDGQALPNWQPVVVRSGQVLNTGRAAQGCRSYIAVRQGLEVPEYLGSKATFALGQFGGHGGRTLRTGDMLAIGQGGVVEHEPACAPAALLPRYGQDWEIAVLCGPHGAPDFFTEAAMREFFAAAWEVHYNSNRLGVRLIGPKPTWARSDGGEAGLHPSNIHDCEYAVGSINFTGDMPVILTRDGPSLGGFVCPVTIVKAELWKVGQVKPGDRIRFRAISFAAARAMELAQDAAINTLQVQPLSEVAVSVSPCIVAELPASGERPTVTYRQAGDTYILLEYGPNVLDLRLRLRVHALMQAIQATPVAGILELAPGVRSLQIHYDSRILPQSELIQLLLAMEATLPASVAAMKIPCRVLHLPLAFEDSATLDAVQRYRETVRDSAPWLPNNVDFIQRINGLSSRDEVRDIVFAARYMVLGLGDVYLGAPCAVPVDPRHRLLTSKYNPARTFTAEGTVGIGGVYMCIYGMDSPGGYQLIGRTLPIWNKYLKSHQFSAGEPWLLRFFDQVRFYPVSEAELVVLREDFREGRANIRIEEDVFDLAAHEQFLHEQAADIAAFQTRQKIAFEGEVSRWQADSLLSDALAEESPVATVMGEGGHLVAADISGSVWKLLVEPGVRVTIGDPLLILEAMKMEFPVHAPAAGIIKTLHCRPGRSIAAGDALLEIELL